VYQFCRSNSEYSSRELIFEAVKRRLNQSTLSENHTCLLEACIEAAESYQ
jgi:hypothetical protein